MSRSEAKAEDRAAGVVADPTQSQWRPLLRTEAWRRVGLIFVALCYAVFFFRMTGTGLQSWFSEDDLLNLHYCWSRPFFDLIRANFVVVSTYYRPFVELLYYVLYSVFGFDPAPLNVVRFALCAANAILICIFVARLSRSIEAGIVAAILGAYHPSMYALYVDSGMLFDVCCFFFYYLAFVIYIRCRLAGRHPGVRLLIGILALYVLALNSKEIAVTFPVAVLLFELIVAPGSTQPDTTPLPGSQSRRSFAAHWRRFRLVTLSAGITLAFIAGRSIGPESLLAHPAYRPEISLARYLDCYSAYAAQFAFSSPDMIRPWTGWTLAGCIALAALLRHRLLLWAALYNVVAILPIAFIPPRSGFAFFVPLAGWTTYLAVLLVWLRSKITFGWPPLRVPSQVALALAIALLVLRPEARFTTRHVLWPSAHKEQDRNRALWTSLRAGLPARVTDKKILLLRDPMALEFASSFLIELGYNEHNIRVDNERRLAEHHLPIRPADYDYVFECEGSKFVPVHAP